jgi:hypothetical protein
MKPDELEQLPLVIENGPQVPDGRSDGMEGTRHGTKHVRIAVFWDKEAGPTAS